MKSKDPNIIYNNIRNIIILGVCVVLYCSVYFFESYFLIGLLKDFYKPSAADVIGHILLCAIHSCNFKDTLHACKRRLKIQIME